MDQHGERVFGGLMTSVQKDRKQDWKRGYSFGGVSVGASAHPTDNWRMLQNEWPVCEARGMVLLPCQSLDVSSCGEDLRVRQTAGSDLEGGREALGWVSIVV